MLGRWLQKIGEQDPWLRDLIEIGIAIIIVCALLAVLDLVW
jgi:hypothetical protein